MRLTSKVKKLEEKLNNNKLCAFIGVPNDTEDPTQTAEDYWDRIKCDYKENVAWVMPLSDTSFKAIKLVGFMTQEEFRESMKANSEKSIG